MKLLIGGSPCTRWSIAQRKNRETTAEGVGWNLFLNYVTALRRYQPDYFLYENNKSMSAAIREQITRELGVEPVLINFALVSAQSRQRLYWVGRRNLDGTYSQVAVEQPEDKRILLRDILESGLPLQDKAYTLKTQYYKNDIANFITNGGFNATGVAEPVRIGTIESAAQNADFDSQQYRVYSPDGKSVTLCGQGGGVGAKTGLYAVPIRVGDMPNASGIIKGGQTRRVYDADGKAVTLTARPNGGGVDGPLYAIPVFVDEHGQMAAEVENGKTFTIYEVQDGQITIKGRQYPIKLADGFYMIRKLTVTECKRLQTVPNDYIFPVSDTQAYKMLGNGWTVNVIAHIMAHFEGITDRPVEVLSMYDGMSCGHIALDKLGANVVRYHATEIDRYAIKTTLENYPDTVQLGDAFQVLNEEWDAGGIIRQTEPERRAPAIQGHRPQYVLSLSYGKDSLACLGAIEKLGWPLDRIIHAEVWATDTIPADLPPMMEFKAKADAIIKEQYGIEVEHVRSKWTYERIFYQKHIFKKVKEQLIYPEKNGIYGFPVRTGPWCNSRLKVSALSKAQRGAGCIYIGIAADEPERFHNLTGIKKSPLVEAGWSEAKCRKWYEERSLLSPIYTDSARGGCWFCHNQSIGQLRLLRHNYPEYWKILLKWDKESPVAFHSDGHTVHDFESRFQLEDEKLIDPQDHVFRWKMLDQPLNYRIELP